MKVIILTVLVTSVIASSAFAAQITGTITYINKKSDTIKLADGNSYHLPENIEVESLGVGEQVKVSYSFKAGHLREVSAVRTFH